MHFGLGRMAEKHVLHCAQDDTILIRTRRRNLASSCDSTSRSGEWDGMRGRVRAALGIVLGLGAAGVTLYAIPQAAPEHVDVPEAQRVDINHSSLEELLKVPGMTKSWAGRIVRFRPYRSKQDLLDKGIVTGEVYNRIRDYIIAHREQPR